MRVCDTCPPPPLRLLTVNVAVGDADEAAWWLPAKEPGGWRALKRM